MYYFKKRYNSIQQLSNHSWRVYEEEEALLFVIPLMLGSASRKYCNLTLNEISRRASDLLLQSKYFLRFEG